MRKYNDRLGATSPAVDTFNNLAEEPTDNGHPGPASSDPTSDLGELLSQEHQRMLLLESSISEGVVKARGYRTVEKKADLKRLGFSDAQCTPPGS
ncbi:MAG: hypothetical protein M3534_04370 [Actinomycetota bacterium]|nr:hypothetical protein [Actinomycetota bacterium]